MPGEIVPVGGHTFYDYDAKYTDPAGAELVTNATLNAPIRDKIMRTAEARRRGALHGHGARRLLSGAGYRSNVPERDHTIPGFTSISMFPRMC